MTDLFDVDGQNLDPGFVNLKVAQSPIEQELNDLLDGMRATYEPYTDPDFRQGFEVVPETRTGS